MGNCELKIKPADGHAQRPILHFSRNKHSQFLNSQLINKKKKHGQEIYLETGHPDVGDHPHGYWYNAGRHFLPVSRAGAARRRGGRKGCLLTDAVIASF